MIIKQEFKNLYHTSKMLENLTRILRNLNSLYLNNIGHQHISDIIFLYVHVIRVCGKSIKCLAPLSF